MVLCRRGGSSLGRIVVARVDAAAAGGGGGRRPAAPPPVVERCFPAPGRVSRKVLVVHRYRQLVVKRGQLFAQLLLANTDAS